MPLIIIHGEDQVKTRQLLSARQKPNALKIDGKSVVFEAIIQACESTSMFEEDKQVVIEDLHKKRSKTDLKEIVEYLGSTTLSFEVILWDSKELTTTELKKFPHAEVMVAKVSPLIFKLTDSLSPTIPFKTTHELLQRCCQEESPEMVLVMIARHLKMLIQSLDPDNKLPPWQKGKLAATAKQMSESKLLTLYHQLADIDYKNKSGQLALDLASELSMWLTLFYSPTSS
jgi:DNA polymerase III delta subunit